jgi:hypothetical protein
MSDREDKLYQLHADIMMKARYFIMGVNASGIAFAFHETTDRRVSLSLYVIGAAVIVWALGFAAGMRVVGLHRDLVAGNLRQLIMPRLANGLPAEDTAGPLAEVSDEIREIQDRTPFFGHALEFSLPLGAIVYLVGHVLYLLSLPPLPAV